MDDDYWNLGFSTSSRDQLSSGNCYEYDEVDDGDEVMDLKAEYPCPFCLEDFDIVGLCCHIDEIHPVEAKSGVCPFCSVRVGMNMVGHMTAKHGDIFTLQRKLKVLSSKLPSSRRDLLEGHLQSFLGGSSPVFSAPSKEADPLLSAFVSKQPASDAPKNSNCKSLEAPNLTEKRLEPSVSKRYGKFVINLLMEYAFSNPVHDLNCLMRDVRKSSLSEGPASSSCLSEEQGEQARRCKFVQGLLWSTFIDDGL